MYYFVSGFTQQGGGDGDRRHRAGTHLLYLLR